MYVSMELIHYSLSSLLFLPKYMYVLNLTHYSLPFQLLLAQYMYVCPEINSLLSVLSAITTLIHVCILKLNHYSPIHSAFVTFSYSESISLFSYPESKSLIFDPFFVQTAKRTCRLRRRDRGQTSWDTYPI